MRNLAPTLAAVLIAFTGAAHATDHSVTQKNKKFSTGTLKVKVGDAIEFRNDDEYFHNVYSLSDEQPFDLGTYGQGQVKRVTLTKPGVVEIECAIHPEMKMKIEVTK